MIQPHASEIEQSIFQECKECEGDQSQELTEMHAVALVLKKKKKFSSLEVTVDSPYTGRCLCISSREMRILDETGRRTEGECQVTGKSLIEHFGPCSVLVKCFGQLH